jgi:hypothetical protein
MYNQTTQVQEKPAAAYYVSLIGGILGLVIGVVTLLFIVGIWILIASVVIIYAAQKLNEQPQQHNTWGIIILLFSIFTPANVLGIIGGILALAYTPTPIEYVPTAQSYTPYSQPPESGQDNRFCSQCGARVAPDAKFCSHCGKQLS